MRDRAAGVGVVALAVVCCAALPIATGLVGGVAIGALLGVVASVIGVAGMSGAALWIRRHRRRSRDRAPIRPASTKGRR